MSHLSEVLRERGYVYQHSSETLEEITDGAQRTLYLGIDPSADSLHIGQLQAFLVLRRFIEAGHKVILLIGGGTGMIGDPGGRSSERNLLDEETVRANGEAIRTQAQRLFGGVAVEMVNNASWLRDVKLLEFLRDVGKHFSVNVMVQRDTVRTRLADPEQSISYTEFSYMLLQSYDFRKLLEEKNCDVQVGGSDQWGNIVSGVDYIRRATGKVVYGLTWPLVINKATGRKFGKSESGAIWLDPAKTSPFEFYQFLLNSEDEAVEEYLLRLTRVPKRDIDTAMALHRASPGQRGAQRLLAKEVTALVHGEDVASRAERASAILFGGEELANIDAPTREMLLSSAPNCPVRIGEPLDQVLVSAKLASSLREARQFIEEGAITLNGGTVSKRERVMMKEDFQSSPVALLKRGKRAICILTSS